MNKLKDPDNKEEIKVKITQCPTLKEIIDLINNTFPEWIVTFLDKYSDDYFHLQENWNIITKKFNTNMKKIIIVEDIIDDEEDYELIQIFSDIFRKLGFIIRAKCEIVPCIVCKSAIPHKPSYDKMKELGLKVPDSWTNKCINC